MESFNSAIQRCVLSEDKHTTCVSEHWGMIINDSTLRLECTRRLFH